MTKEQKVKKYLNANFKRNEFETETEECFMIITFFDFAMRKTIGIINYSTLKELSEIIESENISITTLANINAEKEITADLQVRFFLF